MTISRRTILSGLAGASLLGPWLSLGRALAGTPLTIEEANARAAASHGKLLAIPDLNMFGNEEIAMLLYPGFTALDLVGPHYFFSSLMGAKVHLVTTGSDLSPVASDLGLAITPTMTMESCPAAPTILFVPGGTTGTLACMESDEIRGFVQARGQASMHVTSVCTGSLLLGAAGLLRGKRATGHWVTRDALAAFGAEPVNARVVRDGNVTTGAGVSAGLDFAIALVEVLRGKPYAQALMLQAEYAPEPPLDGGTYDTTEPLLAEAMSDMFAPMPAQAHAIATRLGF